jgi:dTDP-4-dehydrorhamnose 3,5-epimerase
MIFHDTPITGVYIIEPERIEDERGFFARLWNPDAFRARGLNPHIAHMSVSFNRRRGTLRGMHYQAEPMAEAKIVRCTRGAIHDVALDIRPESPTYLQSVGCELSDLNHRMLYIGEGLAHGFQTLRDDSEVLYAISQEYSPAHGRGVRWDDPAFAIAWPEDTRTINERDRTYPDFVR